MKFIKRNGPVEGSYYSYTFTSHDASDVCSGDQVWSDGVNIEVTDFCDVDEIEHLLPKVENKVDFIKALQKDGLI